MNKVFDKRFGVVICLLIFCMVLSVCGWYPTNYENLFTPINKFVDVLIWGSFLIMILSLFSNYRVPGKKELSGFSYLHLICTLGLGGGLFSYCVSPDFLMSYGFSNPIEPLIHWYGPTQWVLFVPFVILEILQANGKLPNWFCTLKMYLYVISMILAISISLLVACNSLPGLIDAIFDIKVSPYALILPIAALVTISLIRGLHKGMKVFAWLAMVCMYFIMGTFVILSWSSELIPYTSDLVTKVYSEFFTLNTYVGSSYQIEVQYPFWIWMFTWAGIMAPFIHKISAGRSLRSVVLYLTFGPVIVCNLYCAIASFTFNQYGGHPLQFISDYSWIGIIYIVMITLMFVTSMDSTCYSMDNQLGGRTTEKRKLIWIIIISLFVTVLMVCGKGTADALYGISYLTAPMLCVLMIFGLIYSLFRLKK